MCAGMLFGGAPKMPSPPPPPPPPPPAPVVNDGTAAANAEKEARRKLAAAGRDGTILTGALGADEAGQTLGNPRARLAGATPAATARAKLGLP